jgi:WD40 repeat protein
VFCTADTVKYTSVVNAHTYTEWIHGCSDARAAVRYTASGDIAYSAAAVGVLLTPSRQNNNSNSQDESVECHSQRFLQGHTDGVTALAVSPDKRFIATGQSGKKAGIRVWSAANGSQLCSLEGPHTW